MLSALYAIARPSVRPSVTRVNPTKNVEVRIMKFLPYGSHITLVFLRDPSVGVKQGRSGENQPFSSFKRQYLVNGRRYV